MADIIQSISDATKGAAPALQQAKDAADKAAALTAKSLQQIDQSHAIGTTVQQIVDDARRRAGKTDQIVIPEDQITHGGFKPVPLTDGSVLPQLLGAVSEVVRGVVEGQKALPSLIVVFKDP